MKAFVAKGKTKNGEVVWLRHEDEGGGHFQWCTNPDDANPFFVRGQASDAASDCPGPWFNMPRAGTIEILEAEYEPARPATLTIHNADHK